MTTGIRCLINVLPQLEKITLREIVASTNRFTRRPTLKDVFGYSWLQDLRDLVIEDYETKEQYLLDFLIRHSSSLSLVRFSHIGVIDSDWASVLIRLRKHKFPYLKSLVLDHCVGDYMASSKRVITSYIGLIKILWRKHVKGEQMRQILAKVTYRSRAAVDPWLGPNIHRVDSQEQLSVLFSKEEVWTNG